MTEVYQVVESVTTDGRVCHRFVEGGDSAAIAHAENLQRNFERNPNIVRVHVFQASAERVGLLRAAKKAS